jgi:hypothetical protein
MKYKNIIKLRLPEIQLLAVVPTQLKFGIVKYHDEPTTILYVGVFQYGNRVASFNANDIFK